MSELSDELREEARWYDRIAAELERLEEERDDLTAEVERLRDAIGDHCAATRADLEEELRRMRRGDIVAALLAGVFLVLVAVAVLVTAVETARSARGGDADPATTTTTTIDEGDASTRGAP